MTDTRCAWCDEQAIPDTIGTDDPACPRHINTLADDALAGADRIRGFINDWIRPGALFVLVLLACWACLLLFR